MQPNTYPSESPMVVNPAVVTLVAPVFNEEEAIPCFTEAIRQIDLQARNPTLDVLFVNDGSSDTTLDLLHALQQKEPFVAYFGQEHL